MAFAGRLLAEARAWLFARLDQGVVCPCCGQYAKRYHRPLTAAMAYGLVIVGRHQMQAQKAVPRDEGWVHVERLLKDTPGIPSSIRGDFTKLRHWGLIEQAWGKRPDGSTRNGYWRVTAEGFDFIAGRSTVASHVVIYNDKREGFAGEAITIKDAIRRQFDYNDVMQRYGLPAEPKPDEPARLFDAPATVKPQPKKRYY